MTTPSQSDPQFKLRLPQELKLKIETAARRGNRSMNAEIIHRLEASFQRLERHFVQPPNKTDHPDFESVMLTPNEHRMVHMIDSLGEQVEALRALLLKGQMDDEDRGAEASSKGKLND